MMKYLFSIKILIFCLLMNGCLTAVKYPDYDIVTSVPENILEIPGGMYKEFDKILFKTTANVFSNRLTGILVIKIYNDDHYRIVFVKEIGLTIFDFEYVEGSWIVHYVIDELDNKYVIRDVQEKIRLVLDTPLEKPVALLANGSRSYIFKYKFMDNYNCYIVNSRDKNLLEVDYVGRKYKKVKVDYYNYRKIGDKDIPLTIKISDYRRKINIELEVVQLNDEFID